jgi:DNA-directed RNA polymerase specialized sigma24 family protein
MSGFGFNGEVAEGAGEERKPGAFLESDQREGEKNSAAEDGSGGNEQMSWEYLPRHNFERPPAEQQAERCEGELYDREWYEDESWDRDPDLWLYRKKTTALLRRYMRWSLAAGRVPSLLGRELFRSRITACTATTFEERVIFLHDTEACLERLQGFDRQIIARVVLQEYDHDAAARILQCDRKTIERRLPELIDELTEAFLRAKLLERLPETKEDTL